jgi:hypothetical protein
MLFVYNGDAGNDERVFNVFQTETDYELFTDTSDRYVTIANALHIVNGTGNNRFSPDNPITRQEAAAMLSRAAAVFEFTHLINAPAQFADGGSVATWARQSVDFVSANGIMHGTGNSLFIPHGHYTREQAILTLLRLFDTLPRQPHRH